MNWIEFARGTLRIEIQGAYPQQCLNRISEQRIPFWDIVQRDSLHMEITIYKAHFEKCLQAVRRGMCDICVRDQRGFWARFSGLRSRPFLLIGLMIALALALWAQGYLWTIEVQGNEMISTQQILWTLSELGVGVGTRWENINPQKLENRMLDRIPELSWFTINANSARATVLVKEKLPLPEVVIPREPTNVVATQTGIVESMEVYDGVPQVELGQTVLKGQLLVSGLTTPFRTTVLHHAMAEIYARTWHSTEIISPTVIKKKICIDEKHAWRLVVGNKLMKICEDGGISGASCDKMTTDYPLMLPGGIILPIALERVTYCEYIVEEFVPDAAVLQERLMSEYTKRVQTEMVAGQIYSAEGTLSEKNGYWHLWAVCECTEQIGELSPILLNTKEDERG